MTTLELLHKACLSYDGYFNVPLLEYAIDDPRQMFGTKDEGFFLIPASHLPALEDIGPALAQCGPDWLQVQTNSPGHKNGISQETVFTVIYQIVLAYQKTSANTDWIDQFAESTLGRRAILNCLQYDTFNQDTWLFFGSWDALTPRLSERAYRKILHLLISDTEWEYSILFQDSILSDSGPIVGKHIKYLWVQEVFNSLGHAFTNAHAMTEFPSLHDNQPDREYGHPQYGRPWWAKRPTITQEWLKDLKEPAESLFRNCIRLMQLQSASEQNNSLSLPRPRDTNYRLLTQSELPSLYEIAHILQDQRLLDQQVWSQLDTASSERFLHQMHFFIYQRILDHHRDSIDLSWIEAFMASYLGRNALLMAVCFDNCNEDNWFQSDQADCLTPRLSERFYQKFLPCLGSRNDWNVSVLDRGKSVFMRGEKRGLHIKYLWTSECFWGMPGLNPSEAEIFRGFPSI